MKNWKHFTVMAIVAIFGIVVTFNACDNGSKDPAHTHDWEWVVTIPATIEADGLETETCKTCGAINGTRPIAQLPDDPNEVKDRTTTVSLFGGLSTLTVKGNLTKPQLDTAASKIKGRLDTFYNEMPAQQDIIKSVFDRGVTYNIEANPQGYSNFKTNGDGKTVYIALDKVDTTYVRDGLTSIATNGTTVSKATPTANKGEEVSQRC